MTRLTEIKPNPFRDLIRTPLDDEKVDALRASIRSTGFWDNVLARKVNGHLELAYGHHRIEAARQELGQKAEVGLIVKPLSDEDMLRIMAAENKEDWNHSSGAQQESIRAVVEAYGAGTISLDAPGKHGKRRYAPSFGYEPLRADKPYTEASLANFLGSGWRASTISDILAQLEEIERGNLADQTFEGISPRYAEEIVSASRHAERVAKAA